MHTVIKITVFMAIGLCLSCGCQNGNSKVSEPTIAAATSTHDNYLPTTTIAKSRTPIPDTPTSIPLVAPTHTIVPTATPTPPSLFPTVTPLEEWLVYENAFYGYQVSYPAEAKLSLEGVLSYPIEDRPAGVSDEAFRAQLEETYPDDICVTITYQTGYVTILAPQDNGGRYTSNCGPSGVGAEYELVEKTELVPLNGESYTFAGNEFWAIDRGRAVRELMYLHLPDGTQIHYGRVISASDDQSVKEVLLQIIKSFQFKVKG